MAAEQQVLQWALTFLSICYAHTSIYGVSCIPPKRVCLGESTGSQVQEFKDTVVEIWADFVLDFEQQHPVFQPCTVSHLTGATTPDRPYCGKQERYCVETNSHCCFLSILSKHPTPCTTWLHFKNLSRTKNKSKFGKIPVLYYQNTTASYHILLAVSGDIELNPGPVKDPCGNCSRPVKCNQRSLLREDCNKFWHLKCIPDVSITQYMNLISSTVDWFCPHCVYKLPFSSCTDTSFQELFDSDRTLNTALEPDTGLRVHFPTPPANRNISGLLLNSRSIRNKQQELLSHLELHPVDIVCITETWLSPDDVFCPAGYSIIRRDRSNGRGGGIMAMVKDCLLPTQLDHLNPQDIEITFLSLTLKRSKWIVGIVYRPPNSDSSFFEKLQNILDSIQVNLCNFEGLVVLGDFNVNWLVESPPLTSLQEVTASIGLSQLVDEVTRPSISSSSAGTVIDLIFTNRPEKFTLVETTANPVNSDHHGVFFSLVADKSPPDPKILRSFLQFKKGDIQHLETLLHLVPWSAFMDDRDPEASWEGFTDILDAAIRDSIPWKTCGRRISPRITPALKWLIKQKRALFIKAKSSGNSDDWRNYRQTRNEVKGSMPELNFTIS